MARGGHEIDYINQRQYRVQSEAGHYETIAINKKTGIYANREYEVLPPRQELEAKGSCCNDRRLLRTLCGFNIALSIITGLIAVLLVLMMTRVSNLENDLEVLENELISSSAQAQLSQNGTANREVPGLKGEPGVMGPVGSPGLKGDTGSIGRRGQKGEVGSEGVKGPPGSIGISGAKGEVGDKGEKGVVGQKGSPGTPGTCSCREISDAELI